MYVRENDAANPLEGDCIVKARHRRVRPHRVRPSGASGHNRFTTTPGGKTDILMYRVLNYKYDGNNPLNTGDRATRAQVVRWRHDGTPDFGAPVPDGAYRPGPVTGETRAPPATSKSQLAGRSENTPRPARIFRLRRPPRRF